MKHKLIRLISVIVIAAFAWQDLIWASSRSGGLNLRYGLSLGHAKGEAIPTGVGISPNPLSPSQSLRPRAAGEREVKENESDKEFLRNLNAVPEYIKHFIRRRKRIVLSTEGRTFSRVYRIQGTHLVEKCLRNGLDIKSQAMTLQLAYERLRGLAAKTYIYHNRVIQEYVEPLVFLKEKKGYLFSISETKAREYINSYFNAILNMWRRGIFDIDPGMQNFGVNLSGDVVCFDFDLMQDDPPGVWAMGNLELNMVLKVVKEGANMIPPYLKAYYKGKYGSFERIAIAEFSGNARYEYWEKDIERGMALQPLEYPHPFPLKRLEERKIKLSDNLLSQSSILRPMAKEERASVRVYVDEKGRRRIDMKSIPQCPTKTILEVIKSEHLQGKIFLIGGAVVNIFFGAEPMDFDLIGPVDPADWLRFRARLRDLKDATGRSLEGMANVLGYRDDYYSEFPSLSIDRIRLGFDTESEDPVLEDPLGGYDDLINRRARFVGKYTYQLFHHRFQIILEKMTKYNLIPTPETLEIFEKFIQTCQERLAGLSARERPNDELLISRYYAWRRSIDVPAAMPMPIDVKSLFYSILRPSAARESRLAGAAKLGKEGQPRAAGETDWIILPDGARVHRTARIGGDCVIEGPNTVIGAGALITRGSIIRDAIVGAGAYIEKSLVATIDDTDKWMYKPRSEFLVESQKPTVVEKGAKVIRSVVYSSRIGENTQLRQTTVEHSDVGRDNYFKMAKLSLAKTKHNVFATWAELSEGVFGWGFHYDGLALGGPAYFEGIYSNRFPVAMVPGADLSRMTQKELTGLIKGPAKLKAFLRRIRFKSIRGVPHVSLYSPYNIYSVFTGKNLPPKSGILEEIRGEPGEQLSQHARNATGPTAAVAANTDIAPRIMGRPDPTRPRDILTNPEYTHQAGFSVSGFNGPMVHGQLRPGAESHSLSPAQINHLWAFTHCPAAVFEMMERIAAALPEEQKGRFDDLAVKAIETAFLMTLYDLNAAQSELRELERKTAKAYDDKKRIARLKKIGKNLIKGLGIYVKNLRENRRRNIWRFKNGQKSISWRHRGKGLWENNYADLAKLSGEARAVYRQYKLRDVLSISSVKPRRPPKTVLTNMDFGLISGKIKGEGQSAVLMADTAHIGKNVRFFGNGKIIIRGNVKLENVVIISDGTVVIDENTNIALGKIEATESQEVYISKDVTLNYAYVRNSEVSAGTKGYYVRLTASRIGEKNELNPFADIGDTKTDAQCIIGHVMRHCNLARGFISRHLPTEAYYLVTPPVIIKIEDKEYIMANPMNIGAGAHIMGKKGRPVAIAGGAFIGSNAWINPDARIESSFVLGEVPEGKILLPLTFYNSGTGEEIVGGLLEEKWAGVLFRTFIYRGKLYTAPENRGAGDYFVPNIISNLAREAVSAQVRRHGIFELIERARPRWEMAGHRFINGRWKYRKRADAWKWEPSRRQNRLAASSVLRPLAEGEGGRFWGRFSKTASPKGLI